MAKGGYRLILETPFQQVESYRRRYGVMFSPSSSRSRLHIVGGGRRYAVRLLTDGSVQYSVDGEASWRSIQPLADPCTGQLLPAFISAKRDALGGDMQTVLEGLRADFAKRTPRSALWAAAGAEHHPTPIRRPCQSGPQLRRAPHLVAKTVRDAGLARAWGRDARGAGTPAHAGHPQPGRNGPAPTPDHPISPSA